MGRGIGLMGRFAVRCSQFSVLSSQLGGGLEAFDEGAVGDVGEAAEEEAEEGEAHPLAAVDGEGDEAGKVEGDGGF